MDERSRFHNETQGRMARRKPRYPMANDSEMKNAKHKPVGEVVDWNHDILKVKYLATTAPNYMPTACVYCLMQGKKQETRFPVTK